MPLLDHFHAPLSAVHRWESFHSNWATKIADRLSGLLPREFIAEEHLYAGSGREIDVATLQVEATEKRNGDAPATDYAPPAPAMTVPSVLPESFEVRVFSTATGLKLVGAIELVSPSNKDRPAERLAFATKVASYLYSGVSVVVLDVVTNRHANLHNETMRLMGADASALLSADALLYAAAYRPVARGDEAEIDLWLERVTLGDPLPTMPLRLEGDKFVPVEFDATYQEACQRRRIS